MANEPIITEVESSAETVGAVRNEIPVGMGGQPIDRIPLNHQLVLLEQQGTYTKKIASTDRCIRVVDVPLRGGTVGKYHCSRACVSVGDQRACPDHDKSLFQPSQTPHGTKARVTNSASIPLTKADSDELARVSKSFAESGDTSANPTAPLAPVKAGAVNLPVESFDKTGPEPHHDLKVYFTLDELSRPDLLAVVKDRLCAALDGLPCNNLRQMKQMVAIQEKIAKIAGKTGRKHGKQRPDAASEG